MISQILIDDIYLHMKHLSAVKPDKSKIKEVLLNNGISEPFDFGKFYNYNSPYQKFIQDYTQHIFKVQ